jgi:predicted metalloprotease
MRWTPRGPSRNLEDRRGEGGFRGAGLGGLGIGGAIIALVLSLIFGGDILGGGGGGGGGVAPVPETSTGAVEQSPEEAKLVEFVSFVLDDAQDVWRQKLEGTGTPYRDAKLVLFRSVVNSACGTAQSAMGPFYCPLDEKVYVDLGFYDELRRRFGAPGDFAQAYVLTHEIGHHVQNVLGIAGQVREMQERRPGAANDLSVRLELQADCFAGIWANSTGQRRLLEQGDIEEGLAAASAVGDDRIQAETTGSIRPESFTHGSSAQRAQWFRRGFESGDPRSCETFQG